MRKESNLQPTVLETVTLPIELRTCNLVAGVGFEPTRLAQRNGFTVRRHRPTHATTAIKLQNHLFPNDFEAESVDL